MISYDIHTKELENGNLLVRLRGEFDLSNLDELRRTLDRVLSFRVHTSVDLSGVTFADLQTLRELAVYSWLYAHYLDLCAPSRQFTRSIEACGFQKRIRFSPGPEPASDLLIHDPAA